MKYTKESLQNTWGVVESKEHADFIIELAVELGCRDYSDIDLSKAKAFVFDKFCDVKIYEAEPRYLHKNGLKQITIPLPPKAKEWPQVGDEVLICNLEPDSRLIEFNNENAKVLAKTKDERGLILTISHPLYGVGAALLISKFIKKPKTKEDLLTEELQTKLCNNNYVDNLTLASDIINGMIPGLSYNSDIESAVKGAINKHLDGGV